MVDVEAVTGCGGDGPCFAAVEKDRKDAGVKNVDLGGCLYLATVPHLDKSTEGSMGQSLVAVSLRVR